jgi:hypothetical protein
MALAILQRTDLRWTKPALWQTEKELQEIKGTQVYSEEKQISEK